MSTTTGVPTAQNGLSVAEAGALTVGKAVYYRDLVALVDYAATVTAITPWKSLTINVPDFGGAKTFNLNVDGTIILPIFSLG